MVSSASSSAPAVVSSAAPTMSAAQSADSSPAASASAVSSAAQESTTASSAASTSSSSSAPSAPSTRSESTISGSGGVIKAGAAQKLPAKVGSWVKAPGSGSGTIYNKGNSTIVMSFLPGSDYAGISTTVTHSRTKVGTGVCGSTESASNLTCYLKTADGVLNVSSDANDTPLVALVDFVDQLTTILGKS